MKVLSIGAIVLLALMAAGAVFLYTPDKSRPTLETKYATPPSRFIEAAGARLHVRDTGPRDAPALIMLHGFASSLQTWDAWATTLSAGYRVIRLDLPGFALSGPDPSGRYTDERAIAVILALMDRLGIGRATLIGNSMGGRIAWRFAAARPDRTDKLVLISPDGFSGPDRTYGQPEPVPAPYRLLRYVLPTAILRQNLAPSYADPSKLTPALVARYRDMLLVPGIRDALIARTGQTVLQDPRLILPAIEAPTLLLWGEQDHLIPIANAQDYLAALPHAELVRLPGQGHVPQEESPDRSIQPLKAFLERESEPARTNGRLNEPKSRDDRPLP